jgi:hypothetical protein
MKRYAALVAAVLSLIACAGVWAGSGHVDANQAGVGPIVSGRGGR